MAWAPSALFNATTNTYDLFWATRLYNETDEEHTGTASLDRIRHATTKDFITFSEPEDYLALDEENIPLIDQEFLSIGQGNEEEEEEEGKYARFLKDENVLHVYQEVTRGGLFGEWTRSPTVNGSGYIATRTFEGPAAFPDINVQGRYYLLMDNYEEYVPFVTEDIVGGVWEELEIGETGMPRGLKHGSVVLVTEEEYDALVESYGL